MNRRQFTFPLLLLVGIGLWFTSRWWLPWLLGFVLPLAQARPLVDENDFYSVASEADQALELLAQLKAQGALDADWARIDPDLHWVRSDPRFAEIVGEA